MEVLEIIGAIVLCIFVLTFFVIHTLVLIYFVKLMSVLPGSLTKIADAIERNSKK